MKYLILLVGALLAPLAPTIASADVDDDYIRVGGYFALGLGGDATGQLNSVDYSAGLDPTIGFGARVERGVWDYVSVGGNFELMTFEADVLDSEREAVFNLDLWVRVRYLFEVNRDLWIEPYVGLPIGLSLGVLRDIDDASGDDDVWPGWNTGVLAGIQVVTSASVGFFFEAGWRFHQVFTNGRIIVDIDAQLETNQFAMQLGAFALFR
ncbi:MAG: hypothetical protein H6719_21635 [Sandaracinaceae bacterium]|nr:hypothetical protein [Sandaracinaceae bacterium]